MLRALNPTAGVVPSDRAVWPLPPFKSVHSIWYVTSLSQSPEVNATPTVWAELGTVIVVLESVPSVNVNTVVTPSTVNSTVAPF